MPRASATALTALIASLVIMGGAVAQSMDHELKATKDTVHWGYFSSTLEPKLTIQSGA